MLPVESPPPAESSVPEKSTTSKLRFVFNWLKEVFYTRKPYIPGDSCRYIWQKSLVIERGFVIYRAAYAFCQFSSLFISFFHVLRHCPPTERAARIWLCFTPLMGMTPSWPMYLTRWGLMMNFAQSLIALVIIFKAYRRQMKGLENPYAASSEHKLRTLTGLNWALHTSALLFAIIIDVKYWIFLGGSEADPMNYVTNLTGHCFNFIYLAVDYAVVAYPVMLAHGIVLLIISTLYGLISFIYYASGGKDDLDEHRYLYEFLNWAHPGRCIWLAVRLICCAFVLLLLILLIDHFKFKCRPQLLKEVISVEVAPEVSQSKATQS